MCVFTTHHYFFSTISYFKIDNLLREKNEEREIVFDFKNGEVRLTDIKDRDRQASQLVK